MFLFTGLGNPGKKYAMNRHNVGFMAVDLLATFYNFPNWKNKATYSLTVGYIGANKVILLKPQIFINKSGLPLAEVARFHKISNNNIFVFHDELDLAPGRLRVKHGGSHSGHNGLRDIDLHIGQSYWRVRIGIGRPKHIEVDVKSWVLTDFFKNELSGWLPLLLDAVCNEAPRLTCHDDSGFMSRVSFLAPPPTSKNNNNN